MADWRSYFPRGVLDPNGPGGEPIVTSTDRRLLWHIESELAVLATSDQVRELRNALASYLHETCRHEWRDYSTCCPEPKDDCYPPHRQCLWCNEVEWLTGDGPRPLVVAVEGGDDRTCWVCGEAYTEPLPVICGRPFCPRGVACRVEAERRAAEVRHAG